MPAIGKQLLGFPGAAEIQAADLIYMSQNGIEVAATPAQLAAGIAQNAARETFVAGPLFTGSIAAAVLTVSVFASGAPLTVGQTVFGAGVNAGQMILSFGTGTGGTGTYNLSASQATVTSKPMGAASSTQFAPGFSPSVTLAGTYGSINNVLVTFDGNIQTDDTLSGQTLGFNPTVPAGVQQVVLIGWPSRSIGAPANGSVLDIQVAANAGINATKLSYAPTVPGSVIRPVSNRLGDSWSLKDFGAKCDGVTDDTSAVIKAFANELDVYFPPGNCVISGTVTVSLSGFRLWGARGTSTFIVQNPNLVGLAVGSYLTGVELEGFTISRAVTATPGGDGLSWTGSNSIGAIRRIVSQGSYRGIVLGPTDFGVFENCIAQKNLSDGVAFVSPAASGNLQWNTSKILSELNGGCGFKVTTNGGGSTSLGTAHGLNTFANSSFGFAAIASGSNSPIHGLRLEGCFFGQDGSHEIYLDTYGTQHVIGDTFLELAGTAATGPTLATPATNVGCGVFATANNSTLECSGVHSNQMSGHGLVSSCKSTVITGGAFTNNGLFVTPSFGILATASSGGRLIVSGAIAGNTGDDALTQSYGVFGDDGVNTVISACDLSGNVTASFSANSNLSSISAIGNLPSTTANNLPGTLAKVGTVYTNP